MNRPALSSRFTLLAVVLCAAACANGTIERTDELVPTATPTNPTAGPSASAVPSDTATGSASASTTEGPATTVPAASETGMGGTANSAAGGTANAGTGPGVGGMGGGGMGSAGPSAGGTGGGGSGGSEGVGGSAGGGGDAVPPSLETLREVIRFFGCNGSDCHGGNEFNPLNLVLDENLHTNLTTTVAEKCENLPVVDPGNPEGSALIRLLKGPCGELDQMPDGCLPGEGGGCVPEDYVAAIEQWVADGAPAD